MNNCYTTLLSSDSYIFGVITQFFALKRFQIQEDYICFVADNLEEKTYNLLKQVGIPYIKYSSKIKYIYKDFTAYETTINKFRGFELKQYNKIMFIDADAIPLENLDYLFEKQTPLLSMAGSGLAQGGIFVYDPKRYNFKDIVDKYSLICWNDEQQIMLMWFQQAIWQDSWTTYEGPPVGDKRVKLFHYGGAPRFWEQFKIDSIDSAKEFVNTPNLIKKIEEGYNINLYYE